MDDVNLADSLVFFFSLLQCSDIFQALKRNQSLRFLDLRTSAVRVGHGMPCSMPDALGCPGMPWDDSDIHHVSHGRSDQPFSEETTRELKDAWNESRPLDHLPL
jgi:hypothetical protein